MHSLKVETVTGDLFLNLQPVVQPVVPTGWPNRLQSVSATVTHFIKPLRANFDTPAARTHRQDHEFGTTEILEADVRVLTLSQTGLGSEDFSDIFEFCSYSEHKPAYVTGSPCS